MVFSKLQNSLKKTREGVFGKVSRLLTAKRKIDDEFLEQLEEILITGDVGVQTSMYLIEKIEERAKEFFKDFNSQLIVWGSDKFLSEYSMFKKIFTEISHDESLILSNIIVYENLLYAIRKDIGHKNKSLGKGDLLSIFITDIDKYIERR